MKNVSNITRGGILTALSVIALYISSLLPTNKIAVLVILALIIPISIIWTNIKTALIIYISTSILGVLLIGLRGSVISYIILLLLIHLFQSSPNKTDYTFYRFVSVLY